MNIRRKLSCMQFVKRNKEIDRSRLRKESKKGKRTDSLLTAV